MNILETEVEKLKGEVSYWRNVDMKDGANMVLGVLLARIKQADTNMVIGFKRPPAIDFLREEVNKYKPFTPFGLNQLPYALYDAVAQAMENYQAACATAQGRPAEEKVPSPKAD